MSGKNTETTVAASAGKMAVSNIFSKLWYREILIFLGTFLFFSAFARMGIDPHHDGVMLIPAIKVANGAVVFRDVFCQYGLLVPLLQGTAVAVFGEELLVIRMLTVCFYSGSAVLLDILWRKFLPEKISWLTPVLFASLASCTMVTFHSWNSVYALFFMLLSGFFLLRYLEDKPWGLWNLAAAGCAATLTWSCRTPCGIVTVFAAILTLAGLNWFTGKKPAVVGREIASYAAGALFIALLAVSYIVFTGAWDDFIKQSFGYVTDFVHHRGSGGSWQYFCDSMFPFYQEEYYYCHSFFALLPLGSMVMLYFLCRKGFMEKGSEMKKILPLAALLILGLGSWHQYYPVPCVRHLYWGGAPLFGAFLLMLYKLWQIKKNIAGKAVAVALTVLLLLCLYPRVLGAYIRLTGRGGKTLDVPGIHGIMLNPGEVKLVETVMAIQTLPEPVKQRGVVNWSEDSLLTLMVDDSGFKDLQFYRFDTAQYPGYDEKILRHIMEKYPVVLTDHPTYIHDYYTGAEVDYMGKKFRILIPVK